MRCCLRNKPFKFCSKFVHTFCGKVRYTNIVDEGSRNPERHSLLIFFYFSFTPFILWNDRKHPVSVPPRRQGVFLYETGFSAVHKPFKFCSKFVHTFWSKVRYTNIVDKGSRNPESIVIYNLLFLFYPLYFVKWSKMPRFRFPHGAGVFSCLGVSLKWLSRILVYIVKNISRSVHDLFTIKGRLRDIL